MIYLIYLWGLWRLTKAMYKNLELLHRPIYNVLEKSLTMSAGAKWIAEMVGEVGLGPVRAMLRLIGIVYLVLDVLFFYQVTVNFILPNTFPNVF